MFTKEICNITLANDIADRLFDNITAHHFMDQTFKATLRAMLHGRLPDHETLHLALVPISTNAITPDSISENIRRNNMGFSYTIYVVYSMDIKNNQMLDVVCSNFGKGRKYYTDFTLHEDLRVFYNKMLRGLFYTNDYDAFIFLEFLDIQKYHALQMMIPKYLPQLFKEHPLTADEMLLLKSLGSKSSSEYERLIEQFAQRFDIRSEIIRTRLKGFETIFERTRADEVSRTILTYQKNYESHLDDLRRLTGMIQDQQIILAGLQCKIDSAAGDESELMEYFLCNKQLSVIRVCGTELEFVVHGYADVFDEEAFKTYTGNLNSYLYTQLDGNIDKTDMERLYRSVFSDGRYKLRMCAAYKADIRNGIKPVQDYIFPPESQTYLPNPHIQRYGCIGGYASRFVEYMSHRDYVGAIDQAVVSAQNLNFHDSTVMSTFAHNLSRTTIKCIEDADGNLMTPREAIQKLKEAAVCQDQSE